MKKILVAGVAIMFSASGAFAAAPANDTVSADKAAKAEERRAVRFQKMDGNHDGGVSKDEWIAQAKARQEKSFARLDANHDGKVTKAELAAGARKKGGRGHAQMAEHKINAENKPVTASTAPAANASMTPATPPAAQ